MAIIGNEQNLIIDPGSRTFDWLVARGMRLVKTELLPSIAACPTCCACTAAEITRISARHTGLRRHRPGAAHGQAAR